MLLVRVAILDSGELLVKAEVCLVLWGSNCDTTSLAKEKEGNVSPFPGNKKKKGPQCGGSYSEFCSSLRDLMWSQFFKSMDHTWITSYFISPARTSSLNSILVYPTAYLTSPLGCLIETSNFMF